MASEETIELGKQVVVVLYRLSDDGTSNYSFETQMRWWDTITTVRNTIRQRTGIPHELIDIVYSGKKISSKVALYQLKVNRNTIRLDYYCRSLRGDNSAWIQIVSKVKLDQEFLDSLDEVRNSFVTGIKPELSLYGSGGTYFLNDAYKWNLLVFKPEDEEPFAENNPRNLQGVTGHRGFRKGIRSGEGWKREVAAFMLDRSRLFSVPTTAQALVCHPYFRNRNPGVKTKVGSLQQFVCDADLCSDWSCSLYSAFEVQKIAFLDMYMMNTDRNDANIMVKRRGGEMKLIPIDHGYCLPDCFEINDLSWCWLDWKQTRQPWDPRIVAFAEQMDVLGDARMLNEWLGIRRVCLLLFRMSGLLLKRGVTQGLSPAELASFYVRRDVNQERPCPLECIVQECVERAKTYCAMRKMARGQEEWVLNHSSSMIFHKPEKEEMVRNYSTQSMSSLAFSEEPYRFPLEIEHKLTHDQEFRHLFFEIYEESISFHIASILQCHGADPPVSF